MVRKDMGIKGPADGWISTYEQSFIYSVLVCNIRICCKNSGSKIYETSASNDETAELASAELELAWPWPTDDIAAGGLAMLCHV